MRTFGFWLGVVAIVVVGALPVGAMAENQRQTFASIFLDKKKIGQVHLTTVHDADGEVQELHARASVTFLGATLYAFSQEHHEIWKNGALQKLSGRTDDNGEVDAVGLERSGSEYRGTLNGEAVTLPHDAFPASLWHYRVTENTLLFNLVNLRLMKVSVKRAEETITWNKEKVPAERFTIAGDWSADAWFDADKDFLQGAYAVAGRRVRIVVDP